MADDIDEVYLEVFGRGVDPTGLASAQSVLAAGGTLTNIRASLAGSAEALNDMSATYAAAGASGPTQTEMAGFKTLMSASYDAPITLIGKDGVLASTSATNLLAELPVLETLDNGRTLSLGMPDGSTLQFTDTARLADFLYAAAAQKSQASTFVTDTFHKDLNWLDQVGQPMLNVAQNLADLAAYDTSVGKMDQAALSNAASRTALQIAAEAPGTRGQISEKVNLPGHVTQVTVFANTNDPLGGATFHDIDPGIGGILEAIGVAVINIAAVAFPETGLPYVAAVVDAGEAGKDFANGQILEGILQLASAAGSFEIGLGGGNALNTATQTGKIILTAAQGVGGVYGAIQSAENGDALGVLAGALEATAAVASGIGKYDPSVTVFANKVSAGLGAASVALSTTTAFASGNLAGGLVSSLSAVLSNIANDYTSDQNAEQTVFKSEFDGPGIDGATGDSGLAFIASDDAILLAGDSKPNLGAYEAGLASTADANAMFIPSDQPKQDSPVTFYDRNGNAVVGYIGLNANPGQSIFPQEFSPQFIIQRGQTDNGLYSGLVGLWQTADEYGGDEGIAQKHAIEAVLLAKSPLQNFRDGGLWDAQRYNVTSGQEYTPIASEYIGMYAAAAGIPEKMIQQMNNDFFSYKGLAAGLGLINPIPAQSMSTIYLSTPEANVRNIETGYLVVQKGLLQ